ncbi:MAG: DUF1573 domain-containing protein [Prolixibacteraceae bacterium]|jgi:hypothetical protein|nr:DUF1573 domain-containing protein [Prolixibacteraceae bacterium]MBT6764776.1 DUF1573 domain-containing protein [Prolixibacteraceae bacterium]MBT7000965.1 DUF1573 domain-containing protein [Prolixibacteraceae bacterium]MBT7394008.1 DUF1573 domain-containing protein [Prolixibacteraceae bacterium]
MFLFLGIVLFGCNGQSREKREENNIVPEKETIRISEIEFNEEMHNFGTLQSGEIVAFTFVFTNTEPTSLTIEKVETDCGCLNAKFSKEPVGTGKTGIVEIEFDSSGLFGKQFKTIEIYANSKESKHLAIFAEIQNEQLEFKY